jgi:osmotically-inducible protein OsmY
MRTLPLLSALVLLALPAHAQTQSQAPADEAMSKKILNAIVKAGVDLRTNSVRVITTSDHTVYLSGLISDKNEIKLAGDTAAKTAPSYKIVNNINSSFFQDQNHVTGDMTK